MIEIEFFATVSTGNCFDGIIEKHLAEMVLNNGRGKNAAIFCAGHLTFWASCSIELS